ncbi:MAG: KGK domain-containing protein [Nostoc sp. CreGUA01]|nr:KGK domain-containing protein [Nostoc sp. CreGUA01]
MNKICQILDCNTDVLLFSKDTYIVSRFKELITENFSGKFYTQLKENSSSVSGLLKKLCINEVGFPVKDIIWQSSSEGIKCSVLRVGSTGWQPGKIAIKVSTQIIPASSYKEHDKLNFNVVLEFYPDEPESPLDDLRKMIQPT